MTNYTSTVIPPVEYEVITLLGHSMARGWAPAPGPTPTAGTVFELDKDTDTIVEVGSSDMLDANLGSPWPAFGIELNSRLGIKPLFVHVAHEFAKVTAAVDGNDFTATGDYWPVAVEKTHTALTLAGKSAVRLFAIILGYNDTDESAAAILAAYVDLIDRINTEFDTPPIHLVRENGYSATADIKKVTKIQSDLVEMYANVSIGADLGTVYNAGFIYDGTHPDDDGNLVIGQCLGRHVEYLLTRNKHAASALSIVYNEETAPHQELKAGFMDYLVSTDLMNTHLEYFTFYTGESKLNSFQSVFRQSPRMSITDASYDPIFNADDSLETVDSGIRGIYCNFNPQTDKRFMDNDDFIFLARVEDATQTNGKYLWGMYDPVEGKTIGTRKNGANTEYFACDLTFTVATSANFGGALGMRRLGSTKGFYNQGVEVNTAAVSVVGANMINGEFILGQFAGFDGNAMGAKFKWFMMLKYDGAPIADLIAAADNVVDNW